MDKDHRLDLLTTPAPAQRVAKEPPMPPIEGVREYLHENSDLLFVVRELPPKHGRHQFIFGRSTGRVFVIMRDAGLITFPVDDPIKAEVELFGAGLQPGLGTASIAQLTTWSFVKNGTRFVFHDWDRITRMIPLLNARKLVVVGAQVRRSLEKRSLKRYDTSYGYLGEYVDESVSVPLYGVSLSGGTVDDWRVLTMKRQSSG